jgi:serine/threonine protein kinase
MLEEDTQLMSLIVERKYRIDAKIGEGSFGKIFSGTNIQTEEVIAVKIEKADDSSLLSNESKIYKLLEEVHGVPKLRSFGKEGQFNYMVIDKLGKSLEEQRVACGGTLTLRTVLALGLTMIKRIEAVHNCGVIHRDIKPDNFLVGNDNLIYLIDFGLAKRFVNKKERHIGMDEGRRLTGTARYASINVHLGLTPSRRDDLESIGYVLIYLLSGNLPWQAIKCSDKAKRYELIGREKINKTLWDQCIGVPGELILFVNYCRSLDFEEDPDYQYLRNILGNLYKHHGYGTSNVYDWDEVH